MLVKLRLKKNARREKKVDRVENECRRRAEVERKKKGLKMNAGVKGK